MDINTLLEEVKKNNRAEQISTDMLDLKLSMFKESTIDNKNQKLFTNGNEVEVAVDNDEVILKKILEKLNN